MHCFTLAACEYMLHVWLNSMRKVNPIGDLRVWSDCDSEKDNIHNTDYVAVSLHLDWDWLSC